MTDANTITAGKTATEKPMAAKTTAEETAAAPGSIEKSLLDELHQVRNELVRLNALHLFGWNSRTANVLFMQFLKGTFIGLGSLVGATIVISVLVYFLSQIEFIPIIGDWVKQINQILQIPK